MAAVAADMRSPDDPAKVKPLPVGAQAPAFVVRDADGKPFPFTPAKLAAHLMAAAEAAVK